jgi:hypothetical protein
MATAVNALEPAPVIYSDVAAYVQWLPVTSVGATNVAYQLYVAVSNQSIVAANTVDLLVQLDDNILGVASLVDPIPEGCVRTDALNGQFSVALAMLAGNTGTGVWFNVMLSGVTNQIKATVSTAAGNDNVLANNRAEAVKSLIWPDLQVSIAALTPSMTEGKTGDFRVTVVNNSVAPVSNVWLTNSYPSYVTLTNVTAGMVLEQTNFVVTGFSLAGNASTNFTLRVVLPPVLPDMVVTMRVEAVCSIPMGDLTPANNRAESLVALLRNGARGGGEWFFSRNSGTYFARLVLTNVSAQAIETLWFAMPDRMTTTNATVIQAALWKTVVNPWSSSTNGPCFPDGVRYVDLTAAMSNMLQNVGNNDGVWDPNEVVVLGVSAATKAKYAERGVLGWSVNTPAERLIEIFDRTWWLSSPADYIQLRDAIGTKAGSLTHESGIDGNRDFIVTPEELNQARAQWLTGSISDEVYLFLSAARYVKGYKWDTDQQKWVIVE